MMELKKIKTHKQKQQEKEGRKRIEFAYMSESKYLQSMKREITYVD